MAVSRKKKLTKKQLAAIHAKRSDLARSASAILAVKGKEATVYHSSFKKKLNLKKRLQPLHVGTLRAAIERASDKNWTKEKGTFLHKLKVQIDQPYIIKIGSPKKRKRFKTSHAVIDENRFNKHPVHGLENLSEIINDWGYAKYKTKDKKLLASRRKRLRIQRKVLTTLRKKGYDVVPYRNSVEHGGSISLAVLDPEKISVESVQHVPWADMTEHLKKLPESGAFSTRAKRKRRVKKT